MTGSSRSHTDTRTEPSQLVSMKEIRGATVKTGLFSRERLFIYEYADGRRYIGYPVHVGTSFVVVDLAAL